MSLIPFTTEVYDATPDILDTAYKCTVEMNSGDFQQTIRDLQVFGGDTCTIAFSVEGVRFYAATGKWATGNIDDTEEDK